MTNLYNRYRPNCFKELIGQEVVSTTLLNSVLQQKWAQSYIFSGPRGTGKTSCARIFAKAINCLNFDGDVCNTCANCQLINNNQTTDVFELDAASNSGVDSIRELSVNTQYLPINLKSKVYIIDEAHMLSTSAWNALLKIVEEPPKHVVFIFSTTEFEKIIPTIQSRCQKHNFFLLEQQVIADQIISIAKLEECDLDKEAAKKITNLAYGSLRDALSLLSQLMINNPKTIKLNDVQKGLFLVDYQSKINFLKLLFDQNTSEVLKSLETIHHNGFQMSTFFQDLIIILMDYLVYQQTKSWDLTEVLKAVDYEAVVNWPNDVMAWIDKLNQGIHELKFTKNIFLVAKITIFGLINLTQKNCTQPNFQQTKIKETTIDVETTPVVKPTVSSITKTKEITTQVKEKQTKISPQTIVLGDYEHDANLFSTQTLLINNPEVQKKVTIKASADTVSDVLVADVIDEVTSVNSAKEDDPIIPSFLTPENLIYYTLQNGNKQLTFELQTQLEAITESDEAPFVNLKKDLIDGKTKLIASNHSVILCFEETIKALEFNDHIHDLSWHQKWNEHFHAKAYWVAVHKKNFKKYITNSLTHSALDVPEFTPEIQEESGFVKSLREFGML